MIATEQTQAELEQALNDFDPQIRRTALRDLLDRFPEAPALRHVANMHCHTFFSFNALGFSPTGLAWLARQQGIELMGIVDFDVLDAVDEFLEACDLCGVRGSAGIETRVFLPEFADREINSPGEPGVYYDMGIGFTTGKAPPAAQAILDELRGQSAQRNRNLVQRVNDFLDPVVVDYDVDVLPLTPSGNATERHIVAAYVRVAEQVVPDPAAFWASKLGMEPAAITKLMQDSPTFQNALRNKLMKRGGPGYVQPGPETFPHHEKLNELAKMCDALPCATWLDGLSAGEQAIEELLTLLVDQGAVALNIVPDRNWNIADPQQRQIKQKKLYEIVDLAEKYALPLNIGTEMNSWGQKIVDDFDAPALAPVRDAFMDGACFIYGHTMLQRAKGLGYQSEWARLHLPDRRARNAFYTAVGKRVLPGAWGYAMLKPIDDLWTPEDILAALAQ